MAASPDPSTIPAAFELKADAFTLPVIRLLNLDMDGIASQLEAKVAQAPAFFLHTPVVIDLAALSEADADLGFPQLVGLLRGLGMIPVGVRGGTGPQQEAAKAMELAILGDTFKPKRQDAGPRLAAEQPSVSVPDPVGAAPAPEPPAAAFGIETGTTLITRPVRSGQRVYAAGGDLTVVAPVNPGAELMADGNIHVYGALRGRVIAGLKGDTAARIFCHELQAELVSVAGHYRVSESIPPELKGRRVQVYLDHEVLRIEPL